MTSGTPSFFSRLCLAALVVAACPALALPMGEKDEVASMYMSAGHVVMAAPMSSRPPLITPAPRPTIASRPPLPTTSVITAFSSDPDPLSSYTNSDASAISTDVMLEDPLPNADGAPEAPIEMPEWTWTLTFFKEKPTETVEYEDGKETTRTVTHYKVVSQKNKGTPTSTLAPGATAAPTAWKLKKDFGGAGGSDIGPDFGVKTWAWGKSLITVVSSIPTTSPVTTFGPQPTAYPYVSPAPNTGNILKVTYPKDSVNPAAQPQGGVGFYAAPIDIAGTNNVSFSYSVYFPSDFDFVRGGKLPGLYGGHGGCSGGQESEDCFSTRLMFRKDGMGELYLYLPKGAQSASLCTMPPTTYCDTTYGYSIGRGAWIFKRGQWTDIKQDIWLNTPGKQNGGFNIWVNGQLALHNHEVMYRKAVQYSTKGQDNKLAQGDAQGSIDDEASSPGSSTENPGETSDTGPADGILAEVGNAIGLGGTGSALGAIRKRSARTTSGSDVGEVLTKPRMGLARMFSPRNETQTAPVSRQPRHKSAMLKGMHNVWVTPQNSTQQRLGFPPSIFATKTDPKDVTFSGIMFDTFFGGSDPTWATPREQNSFFNGLALQING